MAAVSREEYSLGVIDPGVGNDRRAIALQSGRHYFVGPDNGLFGMVHDGELAVSLPIVPNASPTFHGRDVFARPRHVWPWG